MNDAFINTSNDSPTKHIVAILKYFLPDTNKNYISLHDKYHMQNNVIPIINKFYFHYIYNYINLYYTNNNTEIKNILNINITYFLRCFK